MAILAQDTSAQRAVLFSPSTSRGISEMAGNKPAESAFPPRGWEETDKARDEVFSKRAKRPPRGSELARARGEAGEPEHPPLRKRKQDALEDEGGRPSASGLPCRRDRGEEGAGEDDTRVHSDSPAAPVPDTEGKRDFVLSGSEGIVAVGSWAARIEAASLLKARCQPDEYVRLVETGDEAFGTQVTDFLLLLKKGKEGEQVDWNLAPLPAFHKGRVPSPGRDRGLKDTGDGLVESMSSSVAGRKILQDLRIPAEPVDPPKPSQKVMEEEGVKKELFDDEDRDSEWSMVVEKQKAILESLIGDTDGPLPPWAKKAAGPQPSKPERGKSPTAASALGGALPPWARGQAAGSFRGGGGPGKKLSRMTAEKRPLASESGRPVLHPRLRLRRSLKEGWQPEYGAGSLRRPKAAWERRRRRASCALSRKPCATLVSCLRSGNGPGEGGWQTGRAGRSPFPGARLPE